jgi:tetratricopeptide (TPR) repeat protein
MESSFTMQTATRMVFILLQNAFCTSSDAAREQGCWTTEFGAFDLSGYGVTHAHSGKLTTSAVKTVKMASMNLSLRNQVRIVIVTVILLWFLSHVLFVGVRNFLEGWEFWTLLLAIVIGIGAANLLARRALSRYRAAVAREDIQAAKREYEMLRDFWKRRGSEIVKSYGINLLILEGHYRGALEQLEALKIGKKWAPVLTAQVAWCLAQLGEPMKALDLVQPALQRLEGMGPDYACYGHLVLGAAYSLVAKPDDALRHLEKANSTTSPSRKSTLLFYMGECYAALGNAGEARLAYQRAGEALPNGRFGIRAMERIQQSGAITSITPD